MFCEGTSVGRIFEYRMCLKELETDQRQSFVFPLCGFSLSLFCNYLKQTKHATCENVNVNLCSPCQCSQSVHACGFTFSLSSSLWLVVMLADACLGQA